MNTLIKLVQLFAAAVRAHYAEYNTTGKLWLTMGICALIVDAAISFKYGITQTTWHALGFALVAIFFAKVPDATYVEFEEKRYGSGLAMLVACMILGGVALYSHLGYGAGVRTADIQQTNVHNAKFELTSNAAQKVNDNVSAIEARRAKLDAEMDALVNTKVGSWTVTTRPSSAAELDGMIDAKQLEIEREGRTGKGQRYQARMQELAHLKALQGKAKAIEENNAAHAAALAAFAEAKNEVKDSTYQSSTTVNQVNVAAQLYKAVFKGDSPEDAINPSPVEIIFTNLFITGGGSLAFMIMAPLGFFVAGRNRLKPEEIANVLKRQEERNPEATPGTVIVNNTDDSWKEIMAAIGREIRHTPKLAAA